MTATAETLETLGSLDDFLPCVGHSDREAVAFLRMRCCGEKSSPWCSPCIDRWFTVYDSVSTTFRRCRFCGHIWSSGDWRDRVVEVVWI